MLRSKSKLSSVLLGFFIVSTFSHHAYALRSSTAHDISAGVAGILTVANGILLSDGKTEFPVKLAAAGVSFLAWLVVDNALEASTPSVRIKSVQKKFQTIAQDHMTRKIDRLFDEQKPMECIVSGVEQIFKNGDGSLVSAIQYLHKAIDELSILYAHLIELRDEVTYEKYTVRDRWQQLKIDIEQRKQSFVGMLQILEQLERKRCALEKIKQACASFDYLIHDEALGYFIANNQNTCVDHVHLAHQIFVNSRFAVVEAVTFLQNKLATCLSARQLLAEAHLVVSVPDHVWQLDARAKNYCSVISFVIADLKQTEAYQTQMHYKRQEELEEQRVRAQQATARAAQEQAQAAARQARAAEQQAWAQQQQAWSATRQASAAERQAQAAEKQARKINNSSLMVVVS